MIHMCHSYMTFLQSSPLYNLPQHWLLLVTLQLNYCKRCGFLEILWPWMKVNFIKLVSNCLEESIITGPTGVYHTKFEGHEFISIKMQTNCKSLFHKPSKTLFLSSKLIGKFVRTWLWEILFPSTAVILKKSQVIQTGIKLYCSAL